MSNKQSLVEQSKEFYTACKGELLLKALGKDAYFEKDIYFEDEDDMRPGFYIEHLKNDCQWNAVFIQKGYGTEVSLVIYNNGGDEILRLERRSIGEVFQILNVWDEA